MFKFQSVAIEELRNKKFEEQFYSFRRKIWVWCVCVGGGVDGGGGLQQQ
jgi:hypothetical protein